MCTHHIAYYYIKSMLLQYACVIENQKAEEFKKLSFNITGGFRNWNASCLLLDSTIIITIIIVFSAAVASI